MDIDMVYEQGLTQKSGSGKISLYVETHHKCVNLLQSSHHKTNQNLFCSSAEVLLLYFPGAE